MTSNVHQSRSLRGLLAGIGRGWLIAWDALQSARGALRDTLKFTLDSLEDLVNRSNNLRQAQLAPKDEVDANLAASTPYRFFKSEHLFDLRLIALLTAIAFVVYWFVLTVVILLGPAYHFVRILIVHAWHFIQHPFQPGWIHHVVELAAAIADRTIEVALYKILPAEAAGIGAAIPICSGVIGWAYLSAAKRLGVVDLFACEISTICRVGTIFSIAMHYVEKFKQAEKQAEVAEQHHIEHMGKSSDHGKHQRIADAFSSQEEYFPVFNGNSSDLQSLEALVVVNITEFYTYMKASRDLLRKLPETDAIEMPDAMANLIYIVFLGYESGRKSISQLIEFEPTRAEDTIVILLTEITCYKFLREYFAENAVERRNHHFLLSEGDFKSAAEVRKRRLLLREADYKRDIPALYTLIRSDHGRNETLWQPAKELSDELERRYRETFGETIDQTAAKRTITQGEKTAA